MFCWLLESYLCLLFCFLLGLLSRYKTKKLSPEDIYEISLSRWTIIGGSKTPCLKGSILRNEWQSKSEFEGQQGPRDRYFSQMKIIYNMPTCRKHSSFTLNQRIHNRNFMNIGNVENPLVVAQILFNMRKFILVINF